MSSRILLVPLLERRHPLKLRSLTDYRTATGRRRRIRLFGAWRNIQGRTSGRIKAGNGSPAWLGIPVAFGDWQAFRKWSLAHGYSRTNCSLDRIDPEGPYGPDNCRWTTVVENCRWQHYCRKAPFSGVPGPDVPF